MAEQGKRRKTHWRNPFAGEGTACVGGLGFPPDPEQVELTAGWPMSNFIDDVDCRNCRGAIQYLRLPQYRRHPPVQPWADEVIERHFGPESVCLQHREERAEQGRDELWERWARERRPAPSPDARAAFIAGWAAAREWFTSHLGQ